MRRPHPRAIPVGDPRPGLVWPTRIDPDGVTGPTRKQARGPRWQRVAYGLYVPSGLDPAVAVEQRIVTAACEAGPSRVVTGWAALRWQGAGWLDRPDVDIVPERSVERSGIEEIDGIRVTSAPAAAVWAACHAPGLAAAVNVLDRASAADLFSLEEFGTVLGRHGGARGIRQARRALRCAVENSWSPTETSVRLLWRRVGLDRVVCNHPVFDLRGNHLGTPDLLDVERGIVGEYDGGEHLTGAQRARDIRREAAFRRVGLEYVEMVAADLRDPSDFLWRTHDAQLRAASGGVESRQWTIDPPSWWWPTVTVEQRRSLPTALRPRFLAWQGLGLPREPQDGPSGRRRRAI